MDPKTERVDATPDEPLPNGGAYAIVYYQAADGEPVPKSQAVRAEAFEYSSEGKPIAVTLIELGATGEEDEEDEIDD